MDSSDNEVEKDVPRSEKDLIIKKILKDKSSLISKKDKAEEIQQSELSVKDKTIEEILKQKSSGISKILSKKKTFSKHKKIPNDIVKKRYIKIVKSMFKKFKFKT